MINNKPKNLKECIKILENTISKSNKEKIKKMSQLNFIVSQHFGIGMDIRNAWGLWDENSPLIKYFQENNITLHPDDYSGAILKIFYRYLQGEKLDFNNPELIIYGEDLYLKRKEIDKIEKLNISKKEKQEKKLEILFPDIEKRKKFKKILKEKVL